MYNFESVVFHYKNGEIYLELKYLSASGQKAKAWIGPFDTQADAHNCLLTIANVVVPEVVKRELKRKRRN